MADVPGAAGPPGPRPFLEIRPLLRALGIATDARKILLASAGLLALYAGWLALIHAFPGSRLPVDHDPDWPGSSIAADLPEFSRQGLLDAADDLGAPFRTLVAPTAALFVRGLGPAGWLQSALMALWAAIVWGVAGGAIARIAVVQAALDRRVGLMTALRFALGKAGSLIGAPLTPMLAVAILAGGCALFGLLYRIPGPIGGGLAAVFGFVPLLLGLLMALILVGLAFGWPLMHATIAAEGEDAPDALSRSYSYVNQRMARYAAHVLAGLAIGTVGLMGVVVFARVVLGLADWGVSLGAPDLDGLSGWAASGRRFWAHAVGLLVIAWVYSYFWSAASILYLILRRDVDGTAWHDVYLPEHAADTFDGMPPATSSEGNP